jgi:hypothetical protein
MRAANVNNAIRSCFTILSIGALRISGSLAADLLEIDIGGDWLLD